MTNTPLQALVLLNDPTYVEAARALAQRAMLEGGRDADGARLRFAFRLATARDRRRPKKSRVLRATAGAAARGITATTAQAARKLIAVGESKSDPRLDASELAAWTDGRRAPS